MVHENSSMNCDHIEGAIGIISLRCKIPILHHNDIKFETSTIDILLF